MHTPYTIGAAASMKENGPIACAVCRRDLICLSRGAYDVGFMNTMTLEINGRTRQVPPVANVSELLLALGIEGTQVAVELNRRIVRRAEWDVTPIADRDRVEIVQFVGGG